MSFVQTPEFKSQFFQRKWNFFKGLNVNDSGEIKLLCLK